MVIVDASSSWVFEPGKFYLLISIDEIAYSSDCKRRVLETESDDLAQCYLELSEIIGSLSKVDVNPDLKWWLMREAAMRGQVRTNGPSWYIHASLWVGCRDVQLEFRPIDHGSWDIVARWRSIPR